MEQKLSAKIFKYRIAVINDNNAKYEMLPGLFDSVGAAQSELQAYFKVHPPKGAMPYDVGGYIERVELTLGYEPFASTFTKIDEDSF